MTGSAIPPAVVADAATAAKAWLRAAGGADDATIATLADGAIQLAEAWCGRLFIARTAEDAVAAQAAWQPLPAVPVAAIDRVRALGNDGAAATLAPEDYAIDIDAGGVGWVRAIRPLGRARLLVGYRAGDAAGWADLPAPVAQGITMMVAHLFDHREGDQAPPPAVAALWRPWRRTRLSAMAGRPA